MSHWTASLFTSALTALLRRPTTTGGFGTVVKSIFRYPVKAVAAFFVAPFLAFRVARMAKNPVRRAIAGIGLFVSIVLAWLAGTTLGTLAGALLIATKLGYIWGIAFFVGSLLSVTLSVAFSILIFNATSLFFLHASSEEVVEYLRTLSE